MTGITELIDEARDERDTDAAVPSRRPSVAAPTGSDMRSQGKPASAPERSSATPPLSTTAQVPAAMQAEAAQLFARLHPLLDDRGALVLHVAAAQPGEGTTTIARTLATHSASLRRYRTLLIDAAAPSVRSRAVSAGLSLVGARNSGSDLDTAMTRSGSDWLFGATLAGADCAGEPAIAEVGDIYEQLRDSWPIIIVDGPPILQRAEMVNIARKSDGVLLVVRAAQPSHAHLVRARDLVEASGARILGVVLNRFQSHIPRFIERRM